MSIFEPNTPEQQQKPEKLYFEDGLKYYSQTKTREEIEAEIRVMLHAAGSPSASITIEDGNSSTRLAYRLRFLWFGQPVEIVVVALDCKSPDANKTFQRSGRKITVTRKEQAGWQALRYLQKYLEHALIFRNFAEDQELFSLFMLDKPTGKTLASIVYEKIAAALPPPEDDEINDEWKEIED